MSFRFCALWKRGRFSRDVPNPPSPEGVLACVHVGGWPGFLAPTRLLIAFLNVSRAPLLGLAHSLSAFAIGREKWSPVVKWYVYRIPDARSERSRVCEYKINIE